MDEWPLTVDHVCACNSYLKAFHGWLPLNPSKKPASHSQTHSYRISKQVGPVGVMRYNSAGQRTESVEGLEECVCVCAGWRRPLEPVVRGFETPAVDQMPTVHLLK